MSHVSSNQPTNLLPWFLQLHFYLYSCYWV
jgi:hypothetical protein